MSPTPESGFFLHPGCGLNQLAQIRTARRLGIPVTGTDRDPGAPAASDCFAFYPVGWNDLKELTRQLETGGQNAGGIFTRSFGKIWDSIESLARPRGLPFIPARVRSGLQDKLTLQEKISPGASPLTSIPSREVTGRSLLEFPVKSLFAPTRLPSGAGDFGWIAKPRFGFGKQSVLWFRRPEDLWQSPDPATESPMDRREFSDKNWLVSPFIAGLEFTTIGYIREGRYRLHLLTHKITDIHPPFAELLHLYPGKSGAHLERALEVREQKISARPGTLAMEVATKQRQLAGRGKKHPGNETPAWPTETKFERAGQYLCDLVGYQTGPVVAEFRWDGEYLYCLEAAAEIGGEYLADFVEPCVKSGSIFDRALADFYTGPHTGEPPGSGANFSHLRTAWVIFARPGKSLPPPPSGALSLGDILRKLFPLPGEDEITAPQVFYHDFGLAPGADPGGEKTWMGNQSRPGVMGRAGGGVEDLLRDLEIFWQPDESF